MPDRAPRFVSATALPDLVADLESRILRRPDARYVLGVTGPPGAGKSTVAHRIAAAHTAAVVAPMDGFHLSDDELSQRGLLALKGIPESFDGRGFVARLAAVRGEPTLQWPTFDRDREAVMPAGLLIDAPCRLVVVEGNYLLLQTPPWDEVRPLLDEVWYLDVPEPELIARLEARHRQYRTRQDAAAKVRTTDLPNARLVAAVRSRADVVVSFD